VNDPQHSLGSVTGRSEFDLRMRCVNELNQLQSFTPQAFDQIRTYVRDLTRPPSLSFVHCSSLTPASSICIDLPHQRQESMRILCYNQTRVSEPTHLSTACPSTQSTPSRSEACWNLRTSVCIKYQTDQTVIYQHPALPTAEDLFPSCLASNMIIYIILETRLNSFASAADLDFGLTMMADQIYRPASEREFTSSFTSLPSTAHTHT
jgi:hypothetical protein